MKKEHSQKHPVLQWKPQKISICSKFQPFIEQKIVFIFCGLASDNRHQTEMFNSRVFYLTLKTFGGREVRFRLTSKYHTFTFSLYYSCH